VVGKRATETIPHHHHRRPSPGILNSRVEGTGLQIFRVAIQVMSSGTPNIQEARSRDSKYFKSWFGLPNKERDVIRDPRKFESQDHGTPNIFSRGSVFRANWVMSSGTQNIREKRSRDSKYFQSWVGILANKHGDVIRDSKYSRDEIAGFQIFSVAGRSSNEQT